MSDPFTSALVIANPASGTYPPGAAETVRRRLADAGLAAALALTEHPGHARALAAGALTPGGPDLVVAVGGDGTAHEVACGLLTDADTGTTAGSGPGPLPHSGRSPALLTLPTGTGNSFHREIWADLPWRASLERAATAPHVRAIDLARVAENGVPAVLGASTGVVAQSLVTARGIAEAGRDRYEKAVAAALHAFTPYPGRVLVDGEVVQQGPTVFVDVGGGRYRGGRFRLLPHSVMDDGLLDVCVVGTALPLRDLPALARDGSHVGREGVVYARGRSVVVERTDGRPLVFECDGDVLAPARERFTLDVLPGALRVVGPPPGGH
ncbi:diacylglycerol kinase [Streptomyces roseirectus]|uniref:Diacylglycerol kinase n=1 Tax=Streptomyces roseirectus TaxID=2768066 RepID=A0A7H0I848_9ACTN|nr:diacylglycerol kinase family protein [Streptomyces roseirectus]QNP68964.1 diacylglycerol kinase [Streptomyces roseirectus]